MVEYLLLLVASTALLVGSFSSRRGPVRMFETSGPVIATQIEQRLIVGAGFFSRGNGEFIDWQR